MRNNNIFIFAAENSAEKYGAMVVKEFKDNNSKFNFFGIGGKELKSIGTDIIYDSKKLSIVGIVEVLSSIIRLKKLMDFIISEIKLRNCRIAILIDYPDFNLRLAKKLDKAGVSVYYYISPTVWAWRYSRVNTIRKYIKRIFIIFPFEKEIYKRENIPFTYTGHPILSEVKAMETKEEFTQREKIASNENIITLMPGSRESEIDFLLETMLKAVTLLKKENKIKIFLLRANSIKREIITEKLKKYKELNISVYEQKKGYSLINASDLVISTSGTSNLEIALLGVPFLSVYKVNSLSYILGKNFIKINLYSIVNIILGKEVIKEFIQENMTAENIFNESKELLRNDIYRKNMLNEFKKLKSILALEDRPSSIIYNQIIKESKEILNENN